MQMSVLAHTNIISFLRLIRELNDTKDEELMRKLAESILHAATEIILIS